MTIVVITIVVITIVVYTDHRNSDGLSFFFFKCKLYKRVKYLLKRKYLLFVIKWSYLTIFDFKVLSNLIFPRHGKVSSKKVLRMNIKMFQLLKKKFDFPIQIFATKINGFKCQSKFYVEKMSFCSLFIF